MGDIVYNHYLAKDFAGEIAGCAASYGISPGALSLINLAYELTDGCTSIVALDSNNVPHHARNLDFGIGGGFSETLRSLVFVGTVTKGGKPVFIGTFFAGYLGVLSGMRYAADGKTGAYSMTMIRGLGDRCSDWAIGSCIGLRGMGMHWWRPRRGMRWSSPILRPLRLRTRTCGMFP